VGEDGGGEQVVGGGSRRVDVHEREYCWIEIGIVTMQSSGEEIADFFERKVS
jgi:hypothetical protein